MKKLLVLGTALVMYSLLLPAASAQETRTALVPLPSIDDFSRGKDGWSFALGAGIEYETAYEGSDEFGLELEPAGGLQWRRGNDVFYWVGEAIGWRGLRADTWLFEALIGFDEGRAESDSKKGYLNGLGDSDEGFELVLQTRRAFDTDWRYWLVGRLVTGGDGNLGLFGVGRRFGEKFDGSGSEVNIVAVFHDSKYANKDFGITAEQSAASGLTATNMSGGYRSVGINYNYRHYINNNWQIYGEALYEHFSSAVRKSPIARGDFEAEVGIGFIYLF
ncbi:MipA/OmpV family protein [Alishewanella sp. HH-ZS]|uniref:MipA/OmpV family protein n=1 Tax=Alishewanella sp. HH-ZS TaxID=1856684 RepID=UPI0008236908|nr:MipA/OmpV family protein [Alishewanella sp. HH-ZS]OCW92316.1 structural protein MipA [Alishewanella sp. HH-ZS]